MTGLLARENPFRVERLHALRYRFADPGGRGLDGLWERLRAAGGRGAIVGPHGTGKTTLLGDLGALLCGRGIRVRSVRLGAGNCRIAPRERTRLFAGLTSDDAVLLDGAGHLGPWAWARARRAARRAGFFVVTAHSPGRLPTLLRTASSAALLAELTAELGVPLSAGNAARSLEHAGGDVRRALRTLYDAHADG